MTPEYAEKLQAGLEYQDFVCDQLMRRGIFVGQYSSRRYQNERGESASGVEVKLDRRMRETGNVYIEVAEKSDPRNESYIPSGINRPDNTWLYFIGDYEGGMMLSKGQLRAVIARGDAWLKEHDAGFMVETPTSRGCAMSMEYLRRGLCLREFRFA